MAAARKIAAAALLGRAHVATALRAGAARQPALISTQRRQHTAGNGRAAAVALAAAAAACGVASCDDSVVAQWEAKQGEHSWLEEVQGERALAFAKQENAKTETALGDPTHSPTYRKILSVLESKEKIPSVSKIGDFYYNFWTSAENPRGLLRRVASLDEFRKKSPEWEIVLDVDALGKEEGESWVYKGSASCREYDEHNKPIKGSVTRTMVSLSPGGSDAIVRREFDLITKRFVEDTPFRLDDPSKSRCSWVDKDTIYLGADLGRAGDMTSSGYPRRVREWKRGTDPKEAPITFEGEDGDVSVGAYVSRSRGHAFEWRYRTTSFYSSKRWLRRYNGDEPWRALDDLGFPDDASVSHTGSWLLVDPRTPIDVGGKTYAAGSYLAVAYDDVVKNGLKGATTCKALFEPTSTTSLASFSATKDRLILKVLDNVQSKLVFLDVETFRDAGSEAAPQIRGISCSAVDADDSNDYFLRTSTFLEPSTLALGDATAGAAGLGQAEFLKALPAFFDSSTMEAFQSKATSADGTTIPYFVVRTKNAPAHAPCLLYAYGGFEISQTPGYAATIGAGWLERGATYVVANIRGGGEFGPTWHQAAKKEKRHVCVEDLAAVAEDLVEKDVAQHASLGIRGGSNGGLLVGNFYVQRPELVGAVVCAVPLLDMKRYSHLLAGASWRAEYGDPDTEDWSYLKHNSAYHNIDASKAPFPKLLMTTSTKDDRVHPYHARSFVKRLQELGVPDVYYYENMEGGHGGAADAKQSAYVVALYQDFLFCALGGKSAGCGGE